MSGLSSIFGSSSASEWEKDHARFFKAIKGGNLEKIREIADKYPDAVTWIGSDNQSALMTAMNNNEIESFRLLADLGADINEWIPCPSAPAKKAHILFYTTLKMKSDYVEALLERGSNQNAQSQWRQKFGFMRELQTDGNTAYELLVFLKEANELKKPILIDIFKRADTLRKNYLASHATTKKVEDASSAPANADMAAALQKMTEMEKEIQKLTARVAELENPTIIQLDKKQIHFPK